MCIVLKMLLSKSDYMLYLRHPAWLWLKKHAKHFLPPVDPSLQARFDEGHAFEPYVESLFPEMVHLGFTHFAEYQRLPERTAEAWKNGASAVAQGRYEDGAITCISDIVRKDGDGYVLTEIKSSTKAKPEHVFDLAFQRAALEAAGLPIRRSELAHVDKTYLRSGEIDSQELVAFTDLTDEVADRMESTRLRIDEALSVAASNTMPDPAPERARLGSYDEWLEIREKIKPPLEENSIHRLPFMNAQKATALIGDGITTIDAIADPSRLSKSTRRYLSAVANGGRSVDRDALANFLSKIEYPVHYFDYETTQSLVPPWDGTRPYQQVPFQYSLHVQPKTGAEVEHLEYLHRDATNPMPPLLERLREDMGDKGSVVVWYAGFEKSRNDEMAAAFPEHSEFLAVLNERVVDLMEPFADETINDPAFKGSASIKAVLPALVPELSYGDLDIQEGSSAARLWKDATLTNPASPERDKVYTDLVAYCRLDTWAMVAIHRKLQEFVE